MISLDDIDGNRCIDELVSKIRSDWPVAEIKRKVRTKYSRPFLTCYCRIKCMSVLDLIRLEAIDSYASHSLILY